MKKIKILLVLLTIFSLAFLTSCKKPVVEENHVHSWKEWEVLNPATCAAEGLKGRDCKECPEYEREVIAKLVHQYEDDRVFLEPGCLSAGAQLVVCVNCKDVQTKTVEAKGHNFVSGVCDACGIKEKEAEEFTITYEVNGGNLETLTAIYIEGTKINLPIPSKANYLFDGWFTTSSFDGNSKLASQLTITEDVTVYAKWVLDGYSVSLNANGGYVNNNKVLIKGNQMFTFEVPVTNEYVFFDGWYLGEEKLTDEFGKGLKPWNITENAEVKAKWIKEKEIDGVKYIYKGEYPQSLVSNASLIAELEKVTKTNERGYLEYSGSQYTKLVYKAGKTEAYFNNGEKLVDGKTYYFRVDPILWRVLDKDEGVVLTDIILDTSVYYENEKNHLDVKGAMPNNYEYSDVSGWLNGEAKFKNDNFASKAFEDPLKVVKMIDKLDNSAITTGKEDNIYACKDFTVFFYLLSYVEFTDTYGYILDGGKCGVSDYAVAKGLRIDNYSMNGEWWLRSPASDASSEAIVVSAGGILFDGVVSDSNIGIRPAAIFKDLVKKGDATNEK